MYQPVQVDEDVQADEEKPCAAPSSSSPPPQSFLVAKNLILRGLGAVNFFAFLAAYLQNRALVGSAGLVPAANNVLRIAQVFRLLRIVKTLRIIRIFKLARHSNGLQALGYTVRSNYKELGLLILFLGMGAIMFSSLAYVFETEDEKSTLKTMLEAYWWAIITMTTVSQQLAPAAAPCIICRWKLLSFLAITYPLLSFLAIT